MMGSTHGLAGLTIAAAIAAGAHRAGAPLDAAAAAVVVVAGTLAAEAPDLDLRTSRISHGTSTLTAIRPLRPVTMLVTLPVVIAGAGVRALGVSHRGPTHSPAAALLSVPLMLVLYTAYLQLLNAAAGLADRGAPEGSPFHVQDLTGALLQAWPTAAPIAAGAWLAAYLSHLLLDDLTTAPQALLWPASAKKVSVLRWPSIPVGSMREHLLVALPLLLITAAIAVPFIERSEPAGAATATTQAKTRSAK